MIYQIFQAHADLMAPVRHVAQIGASMARILDFGRHTPSAIRQIGAAFTMIAETAVTHRRPSYGLDHVVLGGANVPVTEEIADATPFATLLRFRKATVAPQPKVLLIAPMSGHFATLLRGTLKVMMAEHDVYITDWKNARDVPVSAGVFGFDEFVDHLIRFQQVLGPGAHMVAVCQPTVAALAAVAMMAKNNDPAQPRSMTLMAGPIDTRINPTKVNDLAKSQPIEWFRDNLIATVPWRHAGGGRRVYPGFLQLSAFLSMNLDRHVSAHRDQFKALAEGNLVASGAHRQFYDEYNAVMDLSAEFYLETVQRIFQDHDLPLGKLTWHGEKVEPEAITRTAILTVEGERDDICAVGQTMAALDLCSGVRVGMKTHHLQTGVGHYGVFSGSRWTREVYPKVRQIIQVTS